MDTEKDFVIDTSPALQALVNAIADTYREAGRVLGVSHTHIWHALNGKRKPITVNLLVKYAQRARERTGVAMSFWITEEGRLKYKLNNSD
tara:strand:+ start:779 stop:1048 length:270 start_codon:yes stop_codon:yes gene_type:complete